jgi:hypothetical protein
LADWRHQIVAWSTAFTKIRRAIEPKLTGCEALPAVAGVEVMLLPDRSTFSSRPLSG